MRNPKRIPIFLKHINFEKLFFENWKLLEFETVENLKPIIEKIKKDILEIKSYWKESPDLRFSQVLVNMGYVPNYIGYWYHREEAELLLEQGVEPRDCLFWGVNFDKDMNRLPKTKWKLIKELNSGHLKAILLGNFTKNELYIKAFEDELKSRGEWFDEK